MTMVARRIAALILPAAILASGCGLLGGSDPAPSQLRRGELCEKFSSFIKDDLSVNVEYLRTEGFGEPVGWANTCSPSTVGGITFGNLAVVNSHSGDAEPDDPSYQPQKGFAEDVWLTADGKKFRVQVGSWMGRIYFPDAKLTDGQIRKTFEFLIQTIRVVRDS